MRKLFLALALLLLAGNAGAWTVTGTQVDSAGWWTFAYPSGPDGRVESDSSVYVTSPSIRHWLPAGSVVSTSDSGYNGMWGYSFSSTSELWIQFYFRYAANFDFHTYNKLLYLYNSSHQPVFVIDGPVGGDMWVHPNVGAPFGSRPLGPNITTVATPAGSWHKFKIHLNLSTGLFEYWVNDIKSGYHTDVALGTTLVEANFVPVWGGTGQTGPDVDNYQWYDDAYLSNDTEPGGSPSVDETPPYTNGHDPAKSATGIAKTDRTIALHMLDSGTNSTGVNSANIYLGASVNGAAYTYWSCASGLSCTGSSADYTITRTQAGDWAYADNVSIKVGGSDIQGNWMAEETYVFSIEPDPGPATLAITTTTLPSGTVGTSYSQTLASTGGVSPYTYDTTGTLPPGLSLSSSGVVSGTPTTAGTYAWQARVTDTVPATDNQALSITIAPTIGGDTTTQSTTFADTYINSGSASTNYYDNEALRVYQWPSATTANRIIIMDNTDILALPDNISITSAKLRLYLTDYDGGGGTNPMRVHAKNITGTLPDTTTVTWTNMAGTLGSDLSVTDVTTTPGWFEWSILSAVQAAYAASAPVYIALDGGSDGASDTNRTFASVDHATEAWRPQLVITYTQLTAPGGIRISVPGSLRVSTFKGTMK